MKPKSSHANRFLAASITAVLALSSSAFAATFTYSGGANTAMNQGQAPTGTYDTVEWNITAGYFGTSGARSQTYSNTNLIFTSVLQNNGWNEAVTTFDSSTSVTAAGLFTVTGGGNGQDFVFAGNMTGYTGNINIQSAGNTNTTLGNTGSSIVQFGGTTAGGTVALGTVTGSSPDRFIDNVAGSGSITANVLKFNYGTDAAYDFVKITNAITQRQGILFTGDANIEATGVISGGGALTKQGTGTLVLSGATTYTGVTTVSNGTLMLTGSHNAGNNGGYTIAAGATLDAMTGTMYDTGVYSSKTTTVNGTLKVASMDYGTASWGNAGTNNNYLQIGNGGRVVLDGSGSGGRVFQIAGTGATGTFEVAANNKYTINNGSYAINAAVGAAAGSKLNLEVGSNSTLNIASAIGTGLAVNKTGDGLLSLSGTNDRTSAGRNTSVTAGMLQVGNGGTTGTLVGADGPSISLGATLAYNRSNTITEATVISGAGTLMQIGSGTLNLTAANTYTGVTTVSKGTLLLSGAGTSANSTGFTIGTGATLRLTNTDTVDRVGAVQLTMNGGIFDFDHGANTNAISETVGTLSLAAGANTISTDVSDTTGSSLLTFSSLNWTAGATVNFSGDSGNPSAANDDNNIRFTAAPTLANGIIGTYATVGGTSWATYNTAGSNDSVEALTTYGQDITRLSSGTKIITDAATDNVQITEGTGTVADITLGAATTTINTLLNNAAGGISTINPAGQTLRLNGIMNPTSSGALVIGNGTNNGSLMTATAGGELLIHNYSGNSVTVNSVIANNTDPSALVKSGIGTLALSGANTYSGLTTVNGGTLTVSGTLRETSGITVNSGATADLGAENMFTTGHGSAMENSRVLTANNGTLLMNGSMISRIGNVTLNDGSTWSSNQGLGNYDILLANTSTGAATVTVTGNAASTMNGSGGIHLQGIQNFAVDDVTGNSATDLTVSMILGSQGTTGGAAGGINKTGLGTMQLSANNTFTGNVIVAGGDLQTSGTNGRSALGSNTSGRTITINSGATLKFMANDTFGNATSNPNPSLIINGTVSNASTAFTTLGAVTLNGGSLVSTGGATGGYQGYSLSSSVTATGTSTMSSSGSNSNFHLGSNSSFNVTGASDLLTVSGVLMNRNNDLGGAGGLTKTGAGTMVLSRSNIYTGGTTISDGKLVIDGNQSSATGAVTVDSGATLAGTGTVGGATTINGMHAVGSAAGSVGTQTFSNGVTYASNSIFDWDLNANKDGATGTEGTDWDFVSGTATANTDSIFNVVFGNSVDMAQTFWSEINTTKTWAMTDIFSSFSGSFTTVTTSYDVSTYGSFSITNSGNTLTWSAVPEPTTALAGILLGAGLLRRRRGPMISRS